MSEERYCFTVEIAGMPIGVRCKHRANMLYFKRWAADLAPAFIVEPRESDLSRIRSGLDTACRDEGLPAPSEELIENNAIHELIAEAAADHNVLLIHGSAVELDGMAYIFTAPSGTGKSTHTRLWREAFGARARMIDDDKPMLRFENGAVTVYGTPWNGKHGIGSNISAPLRAVIRLERGEENRIERIGRAEAFQVLLDQCYTPRDPNGTKKVVSMMTQLAYSRRFYRLKCNMDPDAARVAFEGINAAENKGE